MTRFDASPKRRPVAPAGANSTDRCARSGGAVVPTQRPSLRASRALAFALMAVLTLGAVAAQEALVPSGASDDTVSDFVDEVPAVAALGVAFGFPAYRTAGLGASVQSGPFGAAVRGAWGSAGVAVGVQARVYPPVPWPIPTYVAAGADLYGSRVAPHVALGAHVPIGERWRLDVEGGVAWPPLLDARTVAPYLSLGVGYAFALTVAPAAPIGGGSVATGAGAAATCVAGDPDAALLNAAVDATVRRFVSDATATYGSLYRGLRYDVRIVDRDVCGRDASVTVEYEGSVVERATGRTIEASGSAEAIFVWRGCSWARTGLSY